MKSKFRLLPFVFAPLALISLACSVTGVSPAGTPAVAVVTVVIAATSAPVTQAPTAVPTAAPEPNATAISIPGPVIAYNGASLALNINVSRGVGARLVPASEVSADVPPFALNPQYTQFTLDGYPVTQQYRQPTINIYKLDEILKLTPDLAPEVDKFKALLQSQTATTDPIPTIPITNAGQVLHAQVKFLAFNGGTGVRFVTQYAQAVMAVNNQDAFYMFEGLSNDGVYYIQAQFPINSDQLGFSQDDFSGTTVDLSSSDAGAQYEAYLSNLIATLDGLSPDQFKPNLTDLDGIMASLSVQ